MLWHVSVNTEIIQALISQHYLLLAREICKERGQIVSAGPRLKDMVKKAKSCHVVDTKTCLVDTSKVYQFDKVTFLTKKKTK